MFPAPGPVDEAPGIARALASMCQQFRTQQETAIVDHELDEWTRPYHAADGNTEGGLYNIPPLTQRSRHSPGAQSNNHCSSWEPEGPSSYSGMLIAR